MILDKKMCDAYYATAQYQPTPTAVYCRNCGTRLKAYYAESRLYAVKCGYCKTITLVKASNRPITNGSPSVNIPIPMKAGGE